MLSWMRFGHSVQQDKLTDSWFEGPNGRRREGFVRLLSRACDAVLILTLPVRWCLLFRAFHPSPSPVHLPKLGFQIYPTFSSWFDSLLTHWCLRERARFLRVDPSIYGSKNWNRLIQPCFAAEFAAVFQQYTVRYVVLSLGE